MTKIVYNDCYGGFGLSEEAENLYREKSGSDEKYFYDIARDDPILVEVVETLGKAANSRFARLKIVELPEGTEYIIDEYDGYESVMTKSDFDWKVA